MILELSDILRYLLGDGQKHAVPLQKELNLVRNYIALEKIRYGNDLDVHLKLPKDTGDLQIAPLLLLPFLENCFKHGASKFLQSPWINFSLVLNGNTMTMKLMNGKDTSQAHHHLSSGIGIANVRKRLQLLYPEKHTLEISNEADVYIVKLTLELSDKISAEEFNSDLTPLPAYA